jgi:TetR/AcrR family transcriptional repressor of lmrAB and yxaGH operons
MTTTRDQIIQTTSDLLENQGYHATGMSEIVKASGAPKGSIYYYFPKGKEEITSEAVLFAGRMVAERIRVHLANGMDAFKTGLVSHGVAPERATSLAMIVTTSIEGGIILSRTYHTGDPLRQVARELACMLRSCGQ